MYLSKYNYCGFSVINARQQKNVSPKPQPKTQTRTISDHLVATEEAAMKISYTKALLSLMVVACFTACSTTDEPVNSDTKADGSALDGSSSDAGSSEDVPKDIGSPDVGKDTAEPVDANLGPCHGKKNGDECDDSNPCTTDDVCTDGTCEGDAVKCDDGNTCTKDTCNKKGKCEVSYPDDLKCEDGNKCTIGDTCQAGSCIAGKKKECSEDGNKCIKWQCFPTEGCKSEIKENFSCDDSNTCTKDDKCDSEGKCKGGGLINCSDGNPCSINTCDSKTGCTGTPKAGPCDDNNPCTENDYCKDQQCFAGKLKICNDSKPCTDDQCNLNDGTCSYTPGSGSSCNDNNSCTTKDTCNNGKCEGVNDFKYCNDGNSCTEQDSCIGGKCVGKTKQCNDQNPCTKDSCKQTGTGCTYEHLKGDPCEDGILCTIGELCSKGKCIGGKEKNCDDGNMCTKDSCDSNTGKCANDKDPIKGKDCNDGNKCTEKDSCIDGTCKGDALNCEDGKVCTDQSCNPAKGCVFTSKNGAKCDDKNACTDTSVCKGTVCVPLKITQCPNGTKCKPNICNPKTGLCELKEKNCDDSNFCTKDYCDAKFGVCKHVAHKNGSTCSDNDICTQGDVCNSGKCIGNPPTKWCKDDNKCTSDACNSQTGVCEFTCLVPKVNGVCPLNDPIACK